MNNIKYLIFVLLIIVPFDVFAYYEYSDYMYSDSYIEESEFVEVVKERRYKFYEIQRDYSSYIKDETDEFPYKSDDYVYSDEVTISDVVPFYIKSYTEKEYTSYKEYKKIRYISFSDFQTNSNTFGISEIYVDINNKQINVDLSCLECNQDIVNSLTDRNQFSFVSVPLNSNIVVDLGDYYYPNDIKFYICVAGSYMKNYSMNVKLYNDLDEVLYSNFYTGKLSSYELGQFNINMFSDLLILDDNVIEVDNYIDSIDNGVIIDHFKKYLYYDRLYKYYNEKRIYLDDYYVDVDGYIKDEDSYKDYYKYRIKKYIDDESKDENIIDDNKNDNIGNNIIYVDKEIIKEVPIYIENEVIKEIPVNKEVEVLKYVDRNIPIFIDREVENKNPIFLEKEIEIPVYEPIEVSKEVRVEKPEKDNYFVRYFLYLFYYVVFKRKM